MGRPPNITSDLLTDWVSDRGGNLGQDSFYAIQFDAN